MTQESTITGYPSIDKPWLKYYSEEYLKLPLPGTSIYEYMKEKTVGLEKLTALTYYGKKVSFEELHTHIEEAAKVLKGYGVKRNDRILFLLPNIPETAYLFYGANRIGAVSDFADPRPASMDLQVSAEAIYNIVVSEKINHIIVLDRCYVGLIKPVESKLKEFGIGKVMIVSASNSMDGKAKLQFLRQTAQFDGFKALRKSLAETKKLAKMVETARADAKLEVFDYCELSKKIAKITLEDTPYERNKLALILHSSGTTNAKPKPIPLTDDNLNAYVHQTFGANMVMEKGDKALHILPYFAAFGIVDVVHAGFCHGNNLISIPEFTMGNIPKLILEYRPQIVIGAPSWFLGITEDKDMQKADLSCLKMITYGGDSMEKADEMKVNRFLEERGCKYVLTKGHGMSETCGCATYATGDYNVLGSVASRIPHTIYAVVNPETKELIRFEDGENEIEGELIISSEIVTLGRLDDTEIVPRVTYNGEEYIYTRDMAKMDRNGIITFLARNDRSFTRMDGYKVKPHEIEKTIKENPYVKYCVISPWFNEACHGNLILADIVLQDETVPDREKQVNIVKDILENQFVKNPDVSSRQIPSRIRIREAMPLTKNSKVDFNALKKEDLNGTEIKVEFEETNAGMGEIKVR